MLSVFALNLVGGSLAHAQSTDAFGNTNYFGGATQPAQPSTANPVTGPAANEAARVARERQLAAANFNMQMAMLLFMECQKQKKNELCMLGLLALQQAQSLMAEANQSNATAVASEKSGGYPMDTMPANGGNFVNPKDPRVQAARDTLKESGIEVDEDGKFKMPDGSTLAASSFSSPSAMSAAGLDPAALDTAKEIANDLGNSSSVSSQKALAEGVSYGAIPATDAASSSAGGAREPASAEGDRKVSGKTVLLGGEPIGVRGDDIFAMIHARYQKKKSGNQFIESENP